MVHKVATTVAAVLAAAAASTADARSLLGGHGTTMEVVQPVTGYQAVQVMQPVQGYQTMRVRVRPGPVQVAQPVVAQPVAVQQVVQPQVVQVAEAAPATYTSAPGYMAAPVNFGGKHHGRRLSGSGESEKHHKVKGEADGESGKKHKKVKGEADGESGKHHGKHLLGHKGDGEAGEAIKAPKVHKVKGEADGESGKKHKVKGEADGESGKKNGKHLLGHKGDGEAGEAIKAPKVHKVKGEADGESGKKHKVKGEADGESGKKNGKHLLGHKGDGEAGEAIKAPKVHKVKGEADGESGKKHGKKHGEA